MYFEHYKSRGQMATHFFSQRIAENEDVKEVAVLPWVQNRVARDKFQRSNPGKLDLRSNETKRNSFL